MILCELTMPEIEYLKAQCNFTKEQLVLFSYRTKGIPLETCAEMMNVSTSTVNRINKRMKDKINRIK